MKNLVLCAAFASLVTLSACDNVPADTATSQAVKAEGIEAKVTADLSQMDIPEIIEFATGESKDMTALLITVTDGPSAEAAIEDIRVSIPRLNASIRSLENMDIENVTLSIGNMRKVMKAAQSQSGLLNEVVRISKIPEARAVLEKEFDKIELTK